MFLSNSVRLAGAVCMDHANDAVAGAFAYEYFNDINTITKLHCSFAFWSCVILSLRILLAIVQLYFILFCKHVRMLCNKGLLTHLLTYLLT